MDVFSLFLHTFWHVKSVNFTWSKSQHSTLSWPTLHVVFPDAPRSSGRYPVFCPLFRHFEGVCNNSIVKVNWLND